MEHLSKHLLFSIFYLFLLVSCGSTSKNNRIVQINYGVNFGRCIAYCEQNYAINARKFIKEEKAHTDTLRYPTIIEQVSTRKEFWDSLISLSLTSNFFELPDVIACPGCADGGVEWLEIIKKNGQRKKVKFDYLADMGALNPLLEAINPERKQN
jgi:hypothetical protein